MNHRFFVLLCCAGFLAGQKALAKTITVTTADNLNAGAGATSLVQALVSMQDGDTIGFNIPGVGPHYLVTPAGGYPTNTASNITIDGYSQPGASPNTSPILAANNAKIMIFLDSRDGGRTRLEFDGYGTSESAILGFFGGTNVTVRGLGFLARITQNTEDDPSIYCVALGGKAKGAHVNGCWMGVDADGKSVFGANAAVTGFRFRENAEPFLVDDVSVGVKPGSANPEAQFNVIVGMKIPVIIEGKNLHVSGNFIGVLPSGTNEFNNAVAGLPNEGAIQIGRSDGDIVIGTDGDGINDAAERNVLAGVIPTTIEPVNGYASLINFYGGGLRTNIVIAGNYIGVGVDGKTRFTNGVPIVNNLVATTRIGTDFDLVSDAIEGNVIFNNYPPGLFTPETLSRNFLENVGEGALISLRGNKLVNNFTPPVSPLRDDGAFLINYYSKVLLEPENGVIPTLLTNSSVSRLIGTIPLPETNAAPLTVIDVYIADPEGLATGQAQDLSQLPPGSPLRDGFVQGLTYLGSFFEGSSRDLDSAPGRFSFDIRDLNVPVGTVLAITVNYSQEQVGTHNAPTLTTLFSNPVTVKEGGPVDEPPGSLSISVSGNDVTITFRGVLQSAAAASGPWTDVAGAASPFVLKADQATRFFRARSS